MNYLEEYWQMIQSGEVIVGSWIKKEIKNLIDDLKDPRYIYDTTEAHRRIKFQETLCLQSKAPYYMKPIQLLPWQKAWWEAIYSFKMADTGLRRFTEGLLEVARKNGKDLDENTRIPTPNGDKLLKDINVGDYVFGVNGEPVEVLGVRNFTDQKCYEITFEDGEKVVCGEGHLWQVKDKNSERRHKRGTIKSMFYEIETKDLLDNYYKDRVDGKGKEYFYRVHVSKALQYPEKELLIHPYALGVWLGDGLTAGTRIVCGKEDIKETINNLKEITGVCCATPYENHYLLTITNAKKGERSWFTKGLNYYNLKNNKHIPDIYLQASVKQRTELLKGLMDTDGTCTKRGQCEFVQKSETLTNDVSKLLSSLGIKHNIQQKLATCNGKKIPVYRITFFVDKEHSCFKLTRKTDRLKDSLNRRMDCKSIINIIEVPTVPTKCLSVNGGLFLCGDKNTVTHNSTMFACDGNVDLFIGEGGISICCCSNDDRQAKLIWSELGGMRQRIDPKKILTGQNLTEIVNKSKNILVFRLSSKTQNKDGFNMTKTYLDESHDIAEENGQSEIAEAAWRGMSSQEEPLFLNCTSNGFNRDCYLDRKISYSKKVIDGEIIDIHFIAFLYEQDSEQEIWQDKNSWQKSNPSLKYGVKKIAKLERDVEAAKYDKATRIHLLTKDFNIPTNSAEAWLMLEDYDYPIETYNLEEFRGAFCLGFVDLSATTDLSNAKILLMKPNDKTKYIYSHYWIPESKLQDSDDKESGAEYSEWAKNGYITIHEGNEIDLSQVADWFYKLFKEYKIKPYLTGYDQRFSKTFTDKMNDYNFETEMILQGKVLSNAMKLTEAELKAKNINYNQNPIDKWCLSNCSIEVDGFGNIMPVKIRELKGKRIDGAVTLIGLYEVYRRYKSEFQQLVK